MGQHMIPERAGGVVIWKNQTLAQAGSSAGRQAGPQSLGNLFCGSWEVAGKDAAGNSLAVARCLMFAVGCCCRRWRQLVIQLLRG